MSNFSVFKLKSPRSRNSQIRISNRQSGLTPIGDIVVHVPSKKYLAWVFLAMTPVLAVGLMVGSEALRGAVVHVTAPLSAMMLFVSFWYPIQAVKQRRDAIRVNAWKPEISSLPAHFDESQNFFVEVPSRKKIGFVFVASLPAFWFSCLLFQKSLTENSLTIFGAALFFFALSWWFPLRILKRRKRAIELNAWEPKVLKSLLEKEPESRVEIEKLTLESEK